MSRKFKQQVAASALVVAALAVIPVSAEQNTISDDKLVSAIRAAQIVKPELPLRVAVEGSKVIVQTKRTRKQTDDDCKIDAAFIAKSVLNCNTKGVDRVNVLFSHEADEKFDKVAVTHAQVQAFGKGAISEHDLLKSLSMSPVQPAQIRGLGSHAEAEPYASRRLMLVDLIEALRQKGTNVSAFEKLFADVESLQSQSKNEEAEQTIDRLADAIKSQQELAKQAKRVPSHAPTAHSASNTMPTSTISRQGSNASTSQESAHDLRDIQNMMGRIPSEKRACWDQHYQQLQGYLRTEPEHAQQKLQMFKNMLDRELNGNGQSKQW